MKNIKLPIYYIEDNSKDRDFYIRETLKVLGIEVSIQEKEYDTDIIPLKTWEEAETELSKKGNLDRGGIIIADGSLNAAGTKEQKTYTPWLLNELRKKLHATNPLPYSIVLLTAHGDDTWKLKENPQKELEPSMYHETIDKMASGEESFEKKFERYFRYFCENYQEINDCWYRNDDSSYEDRFKGSPFEYILTGTNVKNETVQLQLIKIFAIEVDLNSFECTIWDINTRPEADILKNVRIGNIDIETFFEGQIKIGNFIRIDKMNPQTNKFYFRDIIANPREFASSFIAIAPNRYINPIYFDKCLSIPDAKKEKYKCPPKKTSKSTPPNGGMAGLSYNLIKWAFMINFRDNKNPEWNDKNGNDLIKKVLPLLKEKNRDYYEYLKRKE